MATPKKTPQGTWRIQIEIRGERDSGTFPTKREADEWAARRATEIRALKTGRGGEVRTFGQALKAYRDKVSIEKGGARWEKVRIDAFERQGKFPWGVKLADLTPFMIAAWRDERLKTVTRGTVLREMTLLSSALETARLDWGWLQVNPMRDVRRPAEPDHRERIITRSEVKAMLRSLGWRHRAPVRTVSQAVAGAFLFALKTGMRAGEVCAVRWDDVRADHVRLHRSKTGKGRDVPLTTSAYRTLMAMSGWDDDEVFGLATQSMDATFRKHRGRLGLAGFTFHDSRHTAATRLARRLHILDLCKMFGWRDPKRAMVYYNPSASDIAAQLRM